MALTRMRVDQLANTWVGDDDTPFQIGLLAVFDRGPWQGPDGALDVTGLCHELAARARTVPALRQRVRWTRAWEGRPVWVEDPGFDPASHIGSAELPGGSDVADLATWAANASIERLDPDTPLWRAQVVDGLPGGRFGVLVTVSHVLADGLEGVQLAGSLFDATPDAVPAAASGDEAPSPLPSHRELLLDRWTRQGTRQLRRRAAARPARRRGRALAEFRDNAAALRGHPPATSLPRRVGPERRMAVSTAELATVRRAGRALGVTVNDLVLGVVTQGLRDLLSARGDDVGGLRLRAVVPVAGKEAGAGQAMGMLVVDLPVGEPDLLRRLALIRSATTAGKSRVRESGGDVGDILHLPLPLLHAFVRYGRRIGSSRLNLSVSNVPGPTAPLWLAGARMVAAVPVAPLVPRVPLSVAALSYAGSLVVAANADASLADLHVLSAGMSRSFSGYAQVAEQGQTLPDP